MQQFLNWQTRYEYEILKAHAFELTNVSASAKGVIVRLDPCDLFRVTGS
jgi:hypothetical protein